MPKQSKIISSRPNVAAPVKERPDKYYCTRCPRSFTKQKGNFPGAQSPMWRENGGYLPVCRHCVDELYEHYKEHYNTLGDSNAEKSALRRICLKFDIYWSDDIYKMLSKTSTTNSRVLSYISKSNLYQFVGKTFDDTLDEEAAIDADKAAWMLHQQPDESEDGKEEAKSPQTSLISQIDQDVIEFWGPGLRPDMYVELEQRRRYWMNHLPDGVELGIGIEALIRQICNLEVDINRDRALGKSVDKAIGTLNTLLGSAMLKPSQKTDGVDGAAEKTPFGVWIKRWEDKRPIPDPDPDMQDVDGIVRYIDIWLKGHLSKMLGKKNAYSALYEQEISKMRLERPEFDDDDEETFFSDVFGEEDQDDKS